MLYPLIIIIIFTITITERLQRTVLRHNRTIELLHQTIEAKKYQINSLKEENLQLRSLLRVDILSLGRIVPHELIILIMMFYFCSFNDFQHTDVCS